jgi:hypothetical protein
MSMGTNLYQEAIAEARQLREMAEQNAKNKIIDAVTPKIRALIERELLSEEDMEADDQEVDSLDALPMQQPEEDFEGAGLDPMASSPEHMTLDLDAMTAMGSELQDTMDTMVDQSQPTVNVPASSGMDVEINADGSVKVDTGSVDLHVGGAEEAEDDDILLSRQMAEALTSLLRNERKASTKLKRIQRLEANVRKLSRLFEHLNVNNLQSSHQTAIRSTYTKMLREAFSLYNDAILTEGESDQFGLRRQARSILKEMKQMAYNKKDLFSVLNLFEAEEKEEENKELDEVDALLTLEPADDAEAEELEALLGDLDLELSIEEPEGEEGAEDFGAEDTGGEEEAEEMPLESDGISVDVAVSDDDEIVEISETMLRRELKRMRRQRIRESEGVDAAVLDNFGDGDEEGDSFVDVDEDALLNALADELGDAPRPDAGGRPSGADAMPESRRRRRTRRTKNPRVNESRKNRALTHQLTEYKKAVGSLRTQLTEMNLFNAKLLYANKLMQNRNVTPKQQRAIVEGLDKAKTLREAKLLYQSLTASLNKRSTKGRSLTESRALRTGSSSKSTRPAGAKSGVEADRWAVLAGLNNNK